jgi:hypothetical protein
MLAMASLTFAGDSATGWGKGLDVHCGGRLAGAAGWLFAVALCLAPVAAHAQTSQVITLSNQYSAPQYVAVNGDKTVFVTDSTYSLSALFLVNGAYTTTPMAYDTNFDGFYTNPQGVAVDQGGDVFSASNGNQQIDLWEFRPPSYTSILAQSFLLNVVPHGVAVDSQGNFFVAYNNNVVELPPPYSTGVGGPVGQAGVDHLFGLAVDNNGNVFAADQLSSGSGQIVKMAVNNFQVIQTITTGNLQQPVGVAFDSRGNLYVTDSATNALTEIFAPDYSASAVIDSTHFSSPGGVALDSNDNIFVADTGNNALKEILAQPAVTAVTPAAGPLGGGNTVTITGVHLTGATAVTFGSVAATGFTVAGDTQITATVPAGSSGTVDVLVTTPNGTSLAAPTDKYAYTSGPSVSGVSPSVGPTTGGNSVTINGANFTNASAVSFGVTSVTSFSILGDTQISAVVPPGAAGTVDVTVTTPGGGTSAISPSGEYTYVPGPVVSGISPSSGPTGGGTAVTITGTNFTGVDFDSADVSVSFGGTLSPVVGVVDGATIVAEAPAGAPGTVDVTVITPNGTSVTSFADAFTYVGLPAVTAISPASGPTAGGTIVTITGANFSGATAVSFGASAAVWFNVMSATSITAKAPAGSGTVDVTVTNATGASATSSADHFSYAAPGTRTFVSASNGSDSNTCTRTAPCLTFAAALKNTAPGGEIDVLDPGDFGPVTLTGSITIDGGGGLAAGVGAAAGTSGITVNAGATDVVILRNLSFDGYGETGASGVVFNSGSRLQIENCSFEGFDTAGIAFTPGSGSAATSQMFVEKSTMSGNAGGVLVKPTEGIAAAVTLVAVHIDQNSGNGLIADGTGGSGAISVAISQSSASLNASNGIAAMSGQAGVKVDAVGTTIVANGLAGIQSQGGAATVTVGRSQVHGNATGLQPLGGGILLSAGNNQVVGNGSNGSFTPTTLQ